MLDTAEAWASVIGPILFIGFAARFAWQRHRHLWEPHDEDDE